MKAAVVTFPGSNCDDDLKYALSKSGFHVSSVWHKDSPSFEGYDLVTLPGGFSYGDYLRCGAIAALSPVMRSVSDFAKKGGYTLGICNGFQVLCEVGLLPGALTRNEYLKFVCREVYLRVESVTSPWTSQMKPRDSLTLPIAHGDGRYVIEDAAYDEMKWNEQVLLTYQPSNNQKNFNPNGSSFGIAGVCNKEKNVFGLMPHPERATDLGSRDGMKIFQSLIHFIQGRRDG